MDDHRIRTRILCGPNRLTSLRAPNHRPNEPPQDRRGAREKRNEARDRQGISANGLRQTRPSSTHPAFLPSRLRSATSFPMESPELHGDSSPDAVPRRSQRPRSPPLGNVDCLFAFLDPMEEQRRSSDGLLLLLISVRDCVMVIL